jgi:molybdopterin synthase sulfur carrier subunit
MLNILYFARLRETFGLEKESLNVPATATVAGLLTELRARGGVWADSLGVNKHWRVAVNQDMAEIDTPLKSGDEIAIFPPVTGG